MQLNLKSAPPEEKLKIVAQVIPIWKEKKVLPEEEENPKEEKKILPMFDNERVFRIQKHDYL
jgi:hypothetical protein